MTTLFLSGGELRPRRHADDAKGRRRVIEHWYHAYAAGAWQSAVDEHLLAVADIPFDRRCVGIVGAPQARVELASRFPPGWEVVVAVGDGAEEVTLNVLQQYAQGVDAKVLYAHTKGAANPCRGSTRWRRDMTHAVADDWQRCVELLDSHDAVGPYWLTPEQWGTHLVGSPFFGGNFWWANTSYLRQLPLGMPGPERHWAEGWVGRFVPCNAYSLLDGWPRTS